MVEMNFISSIALVVGRYGSEEEVKLLHKINEELGKAGWPPSFLYVFSSMLISGITENKGSSLSQEQKTAINRHNIMMFHFIFIPN